LISAAFTPQTIWYLARIISLQQLASLMANYLKEFATPTLACEASR